MSLNDITNEIWGRQPQPDPQTTQLQDYLAPLEALEDQPPSTTLNGPDRNLATQMQEDDRDIGPPAVGLPSPKVLGPIPEMAPPKTANEAITRWQAKDINLRPTPNFAKKVERWAQARTMDLLLQQGLVREGRFASNVSDKLIDDIRGGLMYVGAALLGDVTPQDAADAMELAFDSYSDQVISRSQAQAQEIIANHIDPRTGAGPAGASRATLDAVGQNLIAEQDKITAAAIQLKSRKGEEAVQGAFKSLVLASQAKLRTETGVDPETAERLKLEAGALAATTPVAQDQLRFALSIQEDPSFGALAQSGLATPQDPSVSSRPPAALTGPGRLMARTGEVFKDVEDPLLAHRQIEQHFHLQVNRARAQRVGADPDSNFVDMLYAQFPGVAFAIADTRLRNQVTRELRAEEVANPTVFERKLRLARGQRLEGIVEDVVNFTNAFDEELAKVEARESISFITDTETALKQGVGTVFEALSEVGTSLRKAFVRRDKVRREFAVSLTGAGALEAMQAAQEVVDRWEHERRLDDGPDERILPLKDDFSNLRAVLISAERAGEIPYSLRKALFSDDRNDMVANAALLAADVMAPSTVLRMINNGLSLDEVRTAFKAGAREALEQDVLGQTPGPDVLVGPRTVADLEAREKSLIQSLSRMSPLERASTGFLQTLTLAQTRMELGWKELALSFVDDPRTVFDSVAGAVPLAVGAGAAMAPVVSAGRRGVVNAAMNTRLRRAMGDTARHDPAAVHAARRKVGEVLETMAAPGGDPARKVSRRQELYRATASVLEQIDAEHRKGSLGVDGAPDAKRLDSASRQFRRTMRQLGPDEFKNIADAMGVPLQAFAELRVDPSIIAQGAGTLARRFQEMVNLDGFSVQPWVSRNAPKFAREITDAVSRGAAPHWDTMPFSLDAAATRPNLYEKFGAAIDQLRPGSKRIIDSSGQYANQVMNWVLHRAEDTMAARYLQGIQRGNQVDFVEFMRRKYEGELHDLETATPSATLARKQALQMPLDSEELAILQAKETLQGRMRHSERLLATVDRREWDTPVNMARESIVDDATDADLIMWAQNQATAGDRHAFWADSRRVGESFDNFNARVNRILAGIPRPNDSADGLRRSIARRYLNAPGLSTKQRIDTHSGAALTPQAARKLAQERKSARDAREKYEALREEIEASEPSTDAERRDFSAKQRRLQDLRRRARFEDPDFHAEVLGANLGIRTVDLKTDFDDLVTLARTEDVLSHTQVRQRAQDMSDGRVSTMVQRVRDTRATLLFQQRANAMEINNFAIRYKNLPKEKQDLFNTLLAKSHDTGDMRALRAAAQTDPAIARMLGVLDNDPDLKVKNLLEETNHFRHNLLRDQRNAGVLTQAEFETLSGGYAPHLFTSGQHRDLLGAQFPKNIFGTETEGGLDLSEMLRQRHFEKWKAIVSIRGGRSVSHLFDTEAEARRFVDTEYGASRLKSAGEGVTEGKTGLQDPVAILAPRGLDSAQTAGFMKEGPSLFKRLDTLVRDMTQATLLKTFDRPGWALTEAQYRARLAGPDSLRTRAQYGDRPMKDVPENGALRGKWVHRGVAQLIDSMNQAQQQGSRVGRMLQDFQESGDVVTRSFAGSVLALGSAAAKAKQALVSNKITRSVETALSNFVMDSEMFGVTAAGRDFSFFHPRALKNKRRALQELLAPMMGREASPGLIEATRLGVIDDSIIAHSIDPDLQRTLRGIMFSDVSQLQHLRSESVQFLKGLLGGQSTLAGALDSLVGGADTSQLKALRARWEEIDRIQKSGVTPSAADAAAIQGEKLALEALFARQEASISNSVRRGMQALNHIVVGDGKSGLFRDHEPFSRELYARVSNSNRLAAFYHLQDKGMTPEAAVRRINMFMQTYSRVPEALRSFGQSALGSPIVSFPYEMMRIGLNMTRHAPEVLLGFMGGLSAGNFMSMVAGGLDPYKVYASVQSDSAGFPSWLAFASTQIFPHKDGTFSTNQIPALNPLQILREPFGIQSEIFGVEDSKGLSLGGLAVNVASKFLLGNPLTTTIYAGLQGRDPQTGQLLSEGDSFLGRAAGSLSSLLIPPELPFVGTISREVAEGIEKPRYMRSGREIAVSQRAIQGLLGFRLRGWLGSEGALAQIGDGMARALGVQAWTDLPVSSEPQRGFDDRDVLSHYYILSREVDPENARSERVLAEAFTKVRKAQDLLASENPEDRAAGLSLREEALAEYERTLQPIVDFHGKELPRARTPQERANLLERAYRGLDFEGQFDRLSIARKVFVLVASASSQVNQATFQDLLQRTMLDNRDQLRNYSSLQSLQAAVKMLDSHLEAPPSAQGVAELTELREVLRFVQQGAEADFQFENESNEIRRAVGEAFYGGEK